MAASDNATAFSREARSQLAEIEPMSEALAEWAHGRGVPARVVQHVALMLDELITNIVMHGYRNRADGWIRVDAAVEDQSLVVLLSDRAPAFNPLDVPEADTTLSLEEREIGGLGVHFVRKIADALSYARVADDSGDRNQLRIVKRLG